MAPRSNLDVAQLAQTLGDEEQRVVRLQREALDGAYPEALLVRRHKALRSGQRGRVDVGRADHPALGRRARLREERHLQDRFRSHARALESGLFQRAGQSSGPVR
jgi:hypothetical protein